MNIGTYVYNKKLIWTSDDRSFAWPLPAAQFILTHNQNLPNMQ